MNVKEFFNDVISQNRDALKQYFCDDALIYWHVTNEVFNVDEYIKVNCDYPGSWKGNIEIIKETTDGYVFSAIVYDDKGENRNHVTSFITIKNDKIIRLDEYWAEDIDSPNWRKQMHIGRKIL